MGYVSHTSLFGLNYHCLPPYFRFIYPFKEITFWVKKVPWPVNKGNGSWLFAEVPILLLLGLELHVFWFPRFRCKFQKNGKVFFLPWCNFAMYGIWWHEAGTCSVECVSPLVAYRRFGCVSQIPCTHWLVSIHRTSRINMYPAPVTAVGMWKQFLWRHIICTMNMPIYRTPKVHRQWSNTSYR